MLNNKILKAVTFFEEQSENVLIVFSDRLVCNYIKISNYYLEKQVSQLLSKEDQELLHITTKTFPKFIESKELNFFFLFHTLYPFSSQLFPVRDSTNLRGLLQEPLLRGNL